MTKNNKDTVKLLYAASNMQHINNFHLDYIDAFRREGYTVDVMSRGEGADIQIPFEKKLFSRKNAFCRKLIRRTVKEGGYSAVLVHTSLAAFHIRFALPMRKRPKVVNVVHGYLFSKNVNPVKHALLLLCEIITRSKTDAIVTMNREDLEVAKKFRLTSGKIYSSRGMGAAVRDVITPADAVRGEFFPDGAFVLTFVGELSKRKNQIFLIDALSIIKKDIPNAILCLVGEGGERGALEDRAKMLGLSDSVLLVGKRKDACDFIRASDLYVSASSIEGMPFNLIEAMGIGKTVLASDVKGHSDLVDDGCDGFLYRFGDLRGFADKVIRIYRGELSVPEERIKEKYLKYEKSSVFPETYSIMKEAVK